MTNTTDMLEMIDPVTGEIIDQKELVERLMGYSGNSTLEWVRALR